MRISDWSSDVCSSDLGAGDSSSAAYYVQEVLAFFDLKPTLSLLISEVVGGIVLKCVLIMTAMRYVGNEVAGVATRVRAELIKNLLNASWGYFTNQPLGRIANPARSEERSGGKQCILT